ncbi:hypothetical protein ZEAMMB73_Zm00001d039203 [Zea mays]|nr:hypothetical protein ZEAMMB73_Zm00001d039203 [Zea mays]
MMDNGFPLTTEPNILKEMITPPNIVNKMLNVVTGKSSTLGSKLPDAAASFVPWRRTTVKDASNEVYVNIVEELDAYVNRTLATVIGQMFLEDLIKEYEVVLKGPFNYTARDEAGIPREWFMID